MRGAPAASSGSTTRRSRPREIYGAEDADDWDLCTTFVKWGKCSRPGCNWRHEPNGVWWEGAWWRDDGTGWGTEQAAPRSQKQAAPDPARQRQREPEPEPWWRSLPANEECPVSLTPIRDLDQEPFELSAGPPDKATSKEVPKHRFDGSALSMFLVSSGQFMNPVNRRPLTLSECQAIDKHQGKASLRVADAFLLSGGATASSMAQREALSMAHHLFHFPSARGASEANGRGDEPSSQSTPAKELRAQQRQVLPQRDAHVLHAEGGLQVVDDNESDSGSEHAAGGTGRRGPAAAPTPAEAMASAAAARPTAKAKKAPRPPRPAAPAQATSCSGSTASCGAGAVDGGTRRNGATAGQPRSGAKEAPKEKASSATASGAAWLPPCATLDTQREQLEEVEELLAAGTVALASPRNAATITTSGEVEENPSKEGPGEEGLKRLRTAVAEGVLLAEGPGLCCEVKCGFDAEHITVLFTLPLFYPGMPLIATIPRCKPECPEVLVALERALREEALRPAEGGRALERGAAWLQSSGPERLQRLRSERARALEAAEEEPDADESEATARKKEKFSPNWDLCSSFLKTGKCKNKNCKWRHERPTEPPAAASTGTAGKKKLQG